MQRAIGSWKSDGLHLALNVGYVYGLWITRRIELYLTLLLLLTFSIHYRVFDPSLYKIYIYKKKKLKEDR